jgi:hypothetical protein
MNLFLLNKSGKKTHTKLAHWHRRPSDRLSHLLHASTVIEKHRATRKTALTRAPSTSALAQPNVFLDHFFGDICKINFNKPFFIWK